MTVNVIIQVVTLCILIEKKYILEENAVSTIRPECMTSHPRIRQSLCNSCCISQPSTKKAHRDKAEKEAITPGMVRSPAMHEGFRAEDWGTLQRTTTPSHTPEDGTLLGSATGTPAAAVSGGGGTSDDSSCGAGSGRHTSETGNTTPTQQQQSPRRHRRVRESPRRKAAAGGGRSPTTTQQR